MLASCNILSFTPVHRQTATDPDVYFYQARKASEVDRDLEDEVTMLKREMQDMRQGSCCVPHPTDDCTEEMSQLEFGVTECAQDERVWVRLNARDGTVTSSEAERSSTFSGFLINCSDLSRNFSNH